MNDREFMETLGKNISAEMGSALGKLMTRARETGGEAERVAVGVLIGMSEVIEAVMRGFLKAHAAEEARGRDTNPDRGSGR